jgi:transglutaminase/protease-like cytokinesis protein 3
VYRLHYSLDGAQLLDRQQALEAAVGAVLSAVIKEGMSETDRAIALNNWVTAHTEYDFAALSVMQAGEDIARLGYAWEADGTFAHNLAVCLGYALTYSALMNAAGVDTYVVTGDVFAGGSHAWNKVRVDGTWLAVDPTWNDVPGAGANAYLLIHDSQFTGDAARVEDSHWVRDDLVASFATP